MIHTTAPTRTIASTVTPFAKARLQLLAWGAVMAAVYFIYLLVFPLLHAILNPYNLLDMEVFLRFGRQWFAPLYVLGLGILFFAFWKMFRIVRGLAQQDPHEARRLRLWVLGIGLLCGLLLIGLYPITAVDVALYVIRSRLAALYGANPMLLVPASFPQDPYTVLAGEFASVSSPYGPLWELVAQIPMRLGFLDLASGIISMKVIALLAYLGMAALLGWQARGGQGDPSALAFFALNPLVLMEAIGNGHNDILMLALMTLGLILWQRGRWAWAALALTAAALIKLTALVALPLFGMAVLIDAPDSRSRLRRGLAIAAILLAAFVLAYGLFGPPAETLRAALQAAFDRRGFTPSYIFRAIARSYAPENAALAELPVQLGSLLFIALYAFLLAQIARRRLDLLQAGFLAMFGLIMLGSVFRIWYPLWLIPFAALDLTPRNYWRTLLFGLTAELSIVNYYIVWRWLLASWEWGLSGPLQGHWDYWLVMTILTVPWTFGIPLLVPLAVSRKPPAVVS